jgi:site-specific recombinase
MAFRIRHVQLSRDLGVLAIASGALATIEIVFPLSSVYAVGILGAYGVIVAVYLAIAGASLRFDSSSHIASKEGSTS